MSVTCLGNSARDDGFAAMCRTNYLEELISTQLRPAFLVQVNTLSIDVAVQTAFGMEGGEAVCYLRGIATATMRRGIWDSRFNIQDFYAMAAVP